MADRLLLVVEGPDDKHVFWAILARHQFEPKFAIRDEGGFETLIARVAIYLKPGTDVERFGIVVDADDDVLARWQEIRRVLERSGYRGVPESMDPAGTLIEQNEAPTVGVWIMPNNHVPGMLEDYVSFLVPPGDMLYDRACRCVDEIPDAERRFAAHHVSKARIHTWLAWQDDPGTPLGQAITKRYLDADSPHVGALLSWLRRLFTRDGSPP
jgi:hypothetical protein